MIFTTQSPSLLAAAMYGTSMLMARKLGSAQAASVMAFYQNWVFLAGAALTAVGTCLRAFDAIRFSITALT